MRTESPSLVVIARIVKPHGIRGELVLESFSDVEGRFENTKTFVLVQNGEPVKTLHVESHRFFNGRHVLKFQEVSDLTEAENYRGMELALQEEQIGALPSEHYFIHDLIGMAVRTRSGKHLGFVTNIMKTGGVDLLEVGEKGQILIPFTAEICVEVDQANRVIFVEPPEGLLEVNAR